MATISFGGQSGREHNLLLQIMQNVKRVEELCFLRPFLAVAMNSMSSTISTSTERKRSQKLTMRSSRNELMTLFVNFSALMKVSRNARITRSSQMPNGLHQVRGLPMPTAVQIQRVVRLRRCLTRRPARQRARVV